MKKILTVLGLLIIVLVGCGKASEGGVTELTLATWAGGDELAELQEIVDQLNIDNAEEYKIIVESTPADYTLKMQTALSAGQGADLMWMSQDQIAAFAAEDVLVGLDDYVASSELKDLSFNESLIESASYDGAQYGVPWIANPMIMYYNKDIVSKEDQAKLDSALEGTPLTMEEFSTMALSYQSEEQNGVLLNGWPPIEYFLWNFGAQVENEEGQPLFDSEEGKKAVEYIVENIVTNPISPDMEKINSIGYTETFQSGNSAFLMGGVADNVELISGEKVPFEVGYTIVPGEYTFNYSASTVLTKDSENPEVAFKALADITKASFDWKVVPPVDVTTIGFKNYEEYIEKTAPQKVGIGTTIEKAMAQTYPTKYTKNSSKIYGKLYEEIYAPILNANITGSTVNVEELIKNAIKAIESV